MNEMELASGLAKALGQDGVTELAYLTAEFQPFSNAQKPDLIFRPLSGPWAGQVVVVEIKLEKSPRPTGRAYQNLVEHKQFCAEALHERIAQYVFMTNQPVPEFSSVLLARDGIGVVRYAGELAPAISDLRSALGLPSTGQPQS